MKKDSSQYKGSAGELLTCVKLFSEGFIPYKPAVENSKYDLLAEKDDRVYKIEVKTTTQRTENDKGWKVGLRGLRPNRTSTKVKVFDKTNIDILAVCILPLNIVLLINVVDIRNETEIYIFDKDLS